MIDDIAINIFADGADPHSVETLLAEFPISGFTTNPSLMAAAGVTDYLRFAGAMVESTQGLPLSLEVLADDIPEMVRQAKILSRLGEAIYVKIPVTNTQGESTAKAIRQLQDEGVRINVTAILTQPQVDAVTTIMLPGTPSILSIFAGRIADAGQDPTVTVCHAVESAKDSPGVQILWASCREIYNVVQAAQAGCDIITVPYDMLPKLSLIGRDLDDFSLETVRMFFRDAQRSGLIL